MDKYTVKQQYPSHDVEKHYTNIRAARKGASDAAETWDYSIQFFDSRFLAKNLIVGKPTLFAYNIGGTRTIHIIRNK